MSFDLTHYPYPSQRRVILGQRGAVATSQPLATLAGMEMFWAGGNAIDAAIATAIALTVVEPTSNGIGSDAFALVWDGDKLHGLNGSGKSPAGLTLDKVGKTIPDLGWLTVTVPGAVSAWYALWERWGRLPFERLFEPGIRYAEEGFAVSPITAQAWQTAESIYLPQTEPEFQAFKSVFFPGDRAPQPGEIWRSLEHSQTLREIALTGTESFYRGALAQAIAQFSAQTGGLITLDDLASHEPEWVEAIATDYRGYQIWEMPPNTQGIATLIALNILEGFEMGAIPRDSVESFHRQIEAMKLAFADTYAHVADPDWMRVSAESLLDKAYAHRRRDLIQSQAIPLADPGLPQGGTVYLAAADEQLMVSFIQSNYAGFGSGILVPGTGIALQNRALGFSLDPAHPNHLAPLKRPFHTIIPGFISQNGRGLAPFGVMGAPMQPQGHVQVVVNLIDYGLNPQAALDAPRWRFIDRDRVWVEAGVAPEIIQGLQAKGHQIEIAPTSQFGKGQIIFRQNEVLIAASEPRADGLAIAI